MTNKIFTKGVALVLGILFLILPLSLDVRAIENITAVTKVSAVEKTSVKKKIALIVSAVVGMLGIVGAVIWKFCSKSGESSEVQYISGRPSEKKSSGKNIKKSIEEVAARKLLNSNGMVGAVAEMVKTGQEKKYSEKELENLLVQALDPSNWEELQ